jgi:ankyrin repeat protein
VESEKAIIDVCLAGNMAQLRQWGEQGVWARTAVPLSQAVHNGGSIDVLSCLVKELGADVNQRDELGWTALTSAAVLGHHNVVRSLIEELGADVNIPYQEGETPLHMAAAEGHLSVVRDLLQLGADINQGCNLGVTPLMVASFCKYHEVVKWLVKVGADTQTFATSLPKATAAFISRDTGASVQQTAYLETKTHCSNVGCSGAGIMKCTGCKQARYCGEACQLAHWKAHKADCRRWSAELAAGKGI